MDSRPARVACAGIQREHERKQHYATHHMSISASSRAWRPITYASCWSEGFV
jgi:hypothetical protein